MSPEEEKDQLHREALLQMMEQMKDMMAAFSGVRNEMITVNGWDPAAAEYMIIETLRNTNAQEQMKLENLRTFNLQLQLRMAEAGIRG